MSANASPAQAETPSCSGCSLHENLQPSKYGKDHLSSGGPACMLANLADASSGPCGDGPFWGARFALASLGLFLVPILLALTGAIWVGTTWTGDKGGGIDPDSQFLGATGGLFLGMLGAMGVARLLRTQPMAFKQHECKASETSIAEDPR